MSDDVDPVVALKDVDPAVRAAAAFALGDRGRRDAVPDLIKSLADPDTETRARAASSLGRLHAVEAIPELIAMTADTERNARVSAGMALAAIGAPAVEPLLQLYESGASDRAQLPLRVMAADQIVDQLLSTLQTSSSSTLRGAAAELLMRFPEERVIAALNAALSDPDQRVRHFARGSLDFIQRDPTTDDDDLRPGWEKE